MVKRLSVLGALVLSLMLSACGTQKPSSSTATWDNARWDSATWEP